MDTLFELTEKGYTPLAERMRPRRLDEIVGQQHLFSKGAALQMLIERGEVPSMILWGPPGSGKTSIAYAIANEVDAHFYSLSAVLSGVKELREIADIALKNRRLTGKRTILFVDEIHRFNKAQQDAFLPHIEQGIITLIGTTTENPSFEVISPLLSRVKVFVLNRLDDKALEEIIKRTLRDAERGLGEFDVRIHDEAIRFMVTSSDGDARRLLNTLELAFSLKKGSGNKIEITLADVEKALQKKSLVYDKLGEEHYNIISAFIKSMRGSNPDATLYWMARMLEAGEDPLFIARRMVIFASEDVGNADPHAVQVAVSCMQALDFVGMPEGWIPLAQSAVYLATAPKSKSSYLAYLAAKADVLEHGSLAVPKHLRNAPTELMKEMGYGKGYLDPHKYNGNFVEQEYLPGELKGRIYYHPTNNGYEKHISERISQWRKSAKGK